MNSLERSICKYVKAAFRTYEAITGNWLFHAPEHYLQNYLLIKMGANWQIYAEATRKKIAAEQGRPPRGRPPNSLAQRYDLVVWQQSDARLRAVIEIKRTYRTSDLVDDAKRIKKALTSSQKASTGYLIVYSEAFNSRRSSGQAVLESRFAAWPEDLGLHRISTEYLCVDAEDGYSAGFVLMRTP